MLNIRISHCTDGQEKVIEISDKDVAAAFAGSPAPVRVERAAPGTFTKYLDGNPVPDDAENWNIVFDPATGLMWPAEDLAVPNWAASEKACSDLRTGGFDDWRWPTIQERLSIVDYTRTGPALNTKFFRVPGSDWHWTSTRYAGNPSSLAWSVGLRLGTAGVGNQYGSGRVLACRAVSECQDGVTFRQLFDAWQQARKQKVPSENQLQFESNWIDELLTLVDDTRCDPAIDTAAFPSCKGGWYWSSTAYAGDASCAWIVGFYGGHCGNGRRSDKAFVRAVRVAGQ